MPYDPAIAERLRAALAALPDVREKRMFGGVSFMVHDRLTACADSGGGLMVRCAAERAGELLARPGASRPVMRGREMSAGWIVLDAAAVESDVDFRFWLDEALAHNRAVTET